MTESCDRPVLPAPRAPVDPVVPPVLPPAAVVATPQAGVAKLLAGFAAALSARGFRVGRLEEPVTPAGACDLVVATGMPDGCLAPALAAGVPVLTALAAERLAAQVAEWLAVTSGRGVLLPPDPAALWRWWGPHRLYADLAQGVEDGPVRRIVCGARWLLVEGPRGTGVVRLPRGVDGAERAALADHAGAGLRALAGRLRSWDPVDVALGMAAVNAYYNRPDLEGMAENGLDLLRGRGGRVVAVGGFPGIAERLPGARVIEAAPRDGEYPAAAADWLLPGCEAAVLTAATLVNRSLPRLLERAGAARVILTGPGTPLRRACSTTASTPWPAWS